MLMLMLEEYENADPFLAHGDWTEKSTDSFLAVLSHTGRRIQCHPDQNTVKDPTQETWQSSPV